MSDDKHIRAERERIAFDTTDVWENTRRLHRRFSHVFESPNTLRGEHALQAWLTAKCRDATVLEYGCADGGNAIMYRRLGAKRVIGVDISEVSIAEAREKYGDLAEFHCCDAESLAMLDDSSVDAIFGRAILHHLHFEASVSEVFRLLRPGGSAFFVEPLYDNPASMVFRKLTPKARTADERPLSRAQLLYADRLFSSSLHCYCNLVTTPVGMLTSMLPLQPDNLALRAADWADRKLAATPLRHWMRIAYLCWVK
ncbi:MAG: class I SAM-dependent methyltransferase [Candidatus Korobacteraceae bacterium]